MKNKEFHLDAEKLNSKLLNPMPPLYSNQQLFESISSQFKPVSEMIQNTYFDEAVRRFYQEMVNKNKEYIVRVSQLATNPFLEVQNNIEKTLKPIIEKQKATLDIIQNFANSIQLTIPRLTDDEIGRRNKVVEQFAERGWAILFYHDSLILDAIKNDFDITTIEDKWYKELRNFLLDSESKSDLMGSRHLSSPAVESLYRSFESKNYFAAYTLLVNLIDGEITSLSIQDKKLKRKIPKVSVGYGAIRIIENNLAHILFLDVGLFQWLYDFYQDTNLFTLKQPNRHMIDHGQWHSDVTEEDVLKLFNNLLYLDCTIESWEEVINDKGLKVIKNEK